MEDLVAHFENQKANAEIEKKSKGAKQRIQEGQSRWTSKSTRNIYRDKKEKSDTSEKPNPRQTMVAVEYLQQKLEKK